MPTSRLRGHREPDAGRHAVDVAARSSAPRTPPPSSDEVLDDPAVDLVVIATRHDLHARLALEALRRGKHVLVEKPLALTRAELDGHRGVLRQLGEAPAPILLTGLQPALLAVRHRASRRSRRTGPTR